jgi:hypothetical protein
MKPCNYPTQAELLEAFTYVDGQLIRVSTNKRASHVHKGSGRNVTKYKGRNLYTARLIWTLVNGDISPDQYVDHIDQNPANDLIENLRIVSKADNCRNVWKRSNKSGERGVFWRESHQAWYAHSRDKEGKPKFLGYHKNKESASEAVQTFLRNEFPHLYN